MDTLNNLYKSPQIHTRQASYASRYDGYELEHLFDGDNTASLIYADSAYGSKVNRQMLERRRLKVQIHTGKPKGKAMSERASKANRRRSKIRAFVEHPFAYLKGIMGLFVRTIGIDRSTTKIGLANLTYNFGRYIFHETRST